MELIESKKIGGFADLVNGSPTAAAGTGSVALGTPPPADPSGELAAIEAGLKAARARVAAAKAAKDAAADDPAVKLGEARLALARETRAAELAEHEHRVDGVYRAACLEYGEELVARVRTRDGSFVLRRETEKEQADRQKLMAAHADAAAREPKGSDARKVHEQNVEEQAHISAEILVLSDRAHFARVTAKFPNLWFTVGRVMDDLSSGREIVTGKDAGR